jgi:hypothetical protein
VAGGDRAVLEVPPALGPALRQLRDEPAERPLRRDVDGEQPVDLGVGLVCDR